MYGRMTQYVGRMTTTDRLAERVKQLVAARERNVKWLSDKTGIADKTLRRRLIKPGDFTFAEFSAICIALDVAVEDALNFDIDVEALTSRVAA